MSNTKKELPYGPGEKIRNHVDKNYNFDSDQAAGILYAVNEGSKLVLKELKQFEERVDSRFDAVDKRFDAVDTKIDECFDSLMKITLSGFAGIFATVVATALITHLSLIF